MCTTLKLAHRERIAGDPSQDLEDRKRRCEDKDLPRQANYIVADKLSPYPESIVVGAGAEKLVDRERKLARKTASF
jgi:hypothetical protein